MNRHQFYDNLNKYKSLAHSTDFKYYNKIELPNGDFRYFYTKAEWDAYVEGQNRNKYEAAQKAKQTSGGASSIAAIEADQRTQYENNKKNSVSEETKAAIAKKEQEDEAKAKEKKQIEKKKNEVSFALKDAKKDMGKYKDVYRKNKETSGKSTDEIVAMIKGQEDKTTNDIIKATGGTADDSYVKQELAKKSAQFKGKLQEIQPQLEGFVIDYIKDLNNASLNEIVNNKDGLVEGICEKFKKEYNELAKYIGEEYKKIYGMVEESDYTGIIYEVFTQLIKASKEIKELIDSIKKDFSTLKEAVNVVQEENNNKQSGNLLWNSMDESTQVGLVQWVADKIIWLFS